MNEPMSQRVRVLRVEKGLSQASLADLVGCRLQTIWRIEAGESRGSARTLLNLAAALDIDPYELAGIDVGRTGLDP